MGFTVLVVDGHKIFREGLCVFLQTTTDFSIVGEAANGRDALAMADDLHPDLVILDYLLSDMNGGEVVRRLREGHPDTRAIILSLEDEEAYVSAAIRNGAAAYVLKEDTVKHLPLAAGAVLGGTVYFSPRLRRQSLESWESDAHWLVRMNAVEKEKV